MRFHADTFNLNSLSRSLLAGAMLSVVIACADSLSPASAPELESNGADLVIVSEAEKAAFLAQGEAPSLGTASFSNPSASYSILAAPIARMSASSGPRSYAVSRVPFLPEPSPANVLPTLRDDGFFPFFIPIGFDFEFYGDVHDKFSVNYNGFVTFGELPAGNQAFYVTGNIPVPDNPNNMIALAWTDWNPAKAPGSIRYETRGDAPNRRLVLEFAGVPEVGGKGVLTSQLVLEEGSNRVTIYTTSMTITASSHRITQGVENFLGNSASYDSVTNPVNQITSPRVRGFFNLMSDAVSFLPPPPNRAPVTLVAGNVSVNTAPGSCSAAVEVGSPSVTDDAPGASLVGGVRSDGLPLDALYPAGVTTITWTSIDIEEKTSSADQLITVSDAENPSITAPADISADNDAGLGSAALSAGNAVATDNCEHVTVVGARSDGASPWAPFPVGLTTITWTATDVFGNSASAEQSVLVRDVEAPSINVADISVDATSRSGAVVEFAIGSSDNVGVTQVSCTRESGSVFAAGSTPVTCTALDAAGNHVSASFVVRVRGAAEQMLAVLDELTALDLSDGNANPMLNQLRAALQAIERAGLGQNSCKKIDDFIKMLTGKKGADMSSAEVAAILADVRRIMSVLGCQ